MHQFKYGNIQIAVRRATVRTDINASVIAQKAQKQAKESEFGMWDRFGLLCACTVKAKGMPFDPTTLASADEKAVVVAYEQFLDMDKSFKDMWVSAVNKENEPVEDVLSPTVVKDDDLNW